MREKVTEADPRENEREKGGVIWVFCGNEERRRDDEQVTQKWRRTCRRYFGT